ncbi:hypothetical protein TSAR_004046 [Trichomalopsis sarcophagae]|uniref:Uncharacterized protein n=1 Tax=Trichomalopsis sarcophagae TaxID=543379 RepID=A0A232EPH9_9HYME|nr:hypothetical protein TSAR_004046 [Trichomalopsis sarcophagae]
MQTLNVARFMYTKSNLLYGFPLTPVNPKGYLEVYKNRFQLVIIRVDQVLQGHGTTNTGNLARRCFNDPSKFSQALEIDFVLVNNIALILQLLRSKQEINIEKFVTLCAETYNRNYTVYPWSRMCPLVHKLLKHSSDIIQNFPLPIPFYSEDANPLIPIMYINNRLKGQLKNQTLPEMSKYFKESEQMEYEEPSNELRHGCFRDNLHRFKVEDNPNCPVYLETSKDAEHVFCNCLRYKMERKELERYLQTRVTSESMMTAMPSSKDG